MLVYAAFMPIEWRCVSIGRSMVGRRLGTATRIRCRLSDVAVPGLKEPPRWMPGDPLKQVSAYQVASYGRCMTTYAWSVTTLTSDSAPTGNLLPDTITNETSKINCLTFSAHIEICASGFSYPKYCKIIAAILTLWLYNKEEIPWQNRLNTSLMHASSTRMAIATPILARYLNPSSMVFKASCANIMAQKRGHLLLLPLTTL